MKVNVLISAITNSYVQDKDFGHASEMRLMLTRC